MTPSRQSRACGVGHLNPGSFAQNAVHLILEPRFDLNVSKCCDSLSMF